MLVFKWTRGGWQLARADGGVMSPPFPNKEHGRARAGQECLLPGPLPGLHSSKLA